MIVRLCWLWAGIVALAVLNPQPSAAQELPAVESIRILGAHVASHGQLKSLMRTRAPSALTPFRRVPYRRDILLRDLERLESYYADLGYLDATANLTSVVTNQNRVRIVLTVTEGEPTVVHAVELRGLRVIRRHQALDAVETAVGARLSPTRVERDRQRLLELYADRGRPFTTVQDTVVVDGHRALVTFEVVEAPVTRVGEVTIEGTRATKQFVIRRELEFDTGDLFERHRLLKSREQLLRTGFFRDVRFVPAPADSVAAPRFVNLQIVVSERKMGWMEGGVGYNSSKQLRLSGEVGHRNILGNAHRLVLRSRTDFDLDALIDRNRPALDEGRVELAFREPRLWSTRTVGALRVFAELTREGERTTQGILEESVVGVALTADRGVATPLRVRSALENRWITQESLDQDLNPRRDVFVTRSLSFLVQHDLRDNPFDPTLGALRTMLAEIAGGALGGTADFLKLSIATSWYRSLVPGWVLAARIRSGWIRPFGEGGGVLPLDRVPREERFRAGGATTVRGYPEDSLGPQVIEPGQEEALTDRGLMTLLTNLEVRFPIGWRLGGAVFLDGGNVWEEAGDLDLGDFWPESPLASIEDYRYSLGGGVRLRTPVGPLRVDYGYGLVRGEPERLIAATGGGEWHFSLGQAF